MATIQNQKKYPGPDATPFPDTYTEQNVKVMVGGAQLLHGSDQAAGRPASGLRHGVASIGYAMTLSRSGCNPYIVLSACDAVLLHSRTHKDQGANLPASSSYQSEVTVVLQGLMLRLRLRPAHHALLRSQSERARAKHSFTSSPGKL
jgi:hypothetical protein